MKKRIAVILPLLLGLSCQENHTHVHIKHGQGHDNVDVCDTTCRKKRIKNIISGTPPNYQPHPMDKTPQATKPTRKKERYLYISFAKKGGWLDKYFMIKRDKNADWPDIKISLVTGKFLPDGEFSETKKDHLERLAQRPSEFERVLGGTKVTYSFINSPNKDGSTLVAENNEKCIYTLTLHISDSNDIDPNHDRSFFYHIGHEDQHTCHSSDNKFFHPTGSGSGGGRN